jgi:hypothetical protein
VRAEQLHHTADRHHLVKQVLHGAQVQVAVLQLPGQSLERIPLAGGGPPRPRGAGAGRRRAAAAAAGRAAAAGGALGRRAGLFVGGVRVAAAAQLLAQVVGGLLVPVWLRCRRIQAFELV